MNVKNIFASLFMMIGSFLEIITTLPSKNNLFPIYIFSVHADARPFTKYYVSFWDTYVVSFYNYAVGSTVLKQVPGTYTMNGPSGWSLLGLSPFILTIIFSLLGIIGIILSLDNLFKFIPLNNNKNVPITTLTGLISGLITIFLGLLIFLGYANDNSHAGLLLPPTPRLTSWNISIGLGFWFLILAGLFIFFGSLITLDVDRKGLKKYIRSFRKKVSKKNFGSKTPSSEINKFLDEIDEIIHDTH